MGAALFLSTRYAVWVTLRDPVIGTRYSIDIIDYPLLSSPRLMEISAPVHELSLTSLSLLRPSHFDFDQHAANACLLPFLISFLPLLRPTFALIIVQRRGGGGRKQGWARTKFRKDILLIAYRSVTGREEGTHVHEY